MIVETRRAARLRVLAVCALVSACAGRDRAPEPSPAPRLPNVLLQTQDGRSVRFYDDLVKGHAVMINFMFTTCRRACPGTTANLRRVQRALRSHVGRDLYMLSVSLDPEHDTPAVLKEYAQVYGAGPGWYFLSGRREEIEQLRRRLGVYDLNPVRDADRTRHAGLVVLGNEPMDRWSAISGRAKPRQIVEAVERVMQRPEDWKPETWSGGRPPPASSECAAQPG